MEGNHVHNDDDLGVVPETTSEEILEEVEPVADLAINGLQATLHRWIEGPRTDCVAEGALIRIDDGDASVIVTRIDGALHGFHNECIHQGLHLDHGAIDDGILICPWHGFEFDAATGECLSAPGATLDAVPVRVAGGRILVAPFES